MEEEKLQQLEQLFQRGAFCLQNRAFSASPLRGFRSLSSSDTRACVSVSRVAARYMDLGRKSVGSIAP